MQMHFSLKRAMYILPSTGIDWVSHCFNIYTLNKQTNIVPGHATQTNIIQGGHWKNAKATSYTTIISLLRMRLPALFIKVIFTRVSVVESCRVKAQTCTPSMLPR